MTPLDVQHSIALVDLLGRTGASDIEFGYFNDDPPHQWWAKANWQGTRVAVEDHARADFALLEMAMKVVHGGECVKCGRKVAFPHRHAGRCGRVLTKTGPEHLAYVIGCEESS